MSTGVFELRMLEMTLEKCDELENLATIFDVAEL